MNLSAEERLIVALDVDRYELALELVEKLQHNVETFKVGKELFVTCGPTIIEAIHRLKKKVFLDLKLHDIPNTVAKAAVAAAKQGIYMYDIHIVGGREMMEETVSAVAKVASEGHQYRPLSIGVTVLTSLSDEQLQNELGMEGSVKQQVVRLARLGQEAGLDGVVCSPQEVQLIKENCGTSFITVVPGIRPGWADQNDQKRTLTPAEAIRAGADFLVVGRPITKAVNPVEAAEKILEEIREGLEC